MLFFQYHDTDINNGQIDNAAVNHYSISYDRERRLEELVRQSTIKQDDFITRERARLRQYYNDRFEHVLKQYEECNKREDFVQAYFHYDTAQRINEVLKILETRS